MNYRLVETFGDSTVALPTGEQITVPCLLEGPDGFNYLVIDEETVHHTVWKAARVLGIEGVIKFGLTSRDQYLTFEQFDYYADDTSREGLYYVPTFIWYENLPEWLKVSENRSEGRESTFINLHTHAEFSALDGYSTIPEMVKRVKHLGQDSVALTDHGICAGHPELQKVCDEEGIKPIFGMEAYLVPDRFNRDPENQYKYQHIVLWALTDEGLHNLWAMSTEAYRDGFYRYPKLDYETLEKFNTGVAASSACLRGPLLEPYLKGDVAGAIQSLSKLKRIFDDRFYIEIHANQLEKQITGNRWLVEKAREFDIPLLAAMDSHYSVEEDRDDHQVWLAMQTGKDVSQETSLFGGGQNYHLASTEEIGASLAYLMEAGQEAIANTQKLADRCNARIKPKTDMPIYSVGDNAAEKDIDKMFEVCLANWDERVKGKPNPESEYLARFEREASLLVKKGFPGYFLMNADIVGYAKDNGVLVGPGRGSGAGSLVAYLMRITEIDPVENDLLFERFMTEGRTALPDFDIDYPSSRKQFMIDYAEKRWGKEHVVAVGTHQRLKNKGAFKSTAGAIRSRLPQGYEGDLAAISGIITRAEASTAGLGLSWDKLTAQCEKEFAPYKEKMPYLFEMAEKFRGRLKTYSRHAAGIVIDPAENLEQSLPMMLSSDGVTLVSQFDKDVLDMLGYVKFDFLNLRNLDTIQDTVDLIKKTTGVVIDVNKWRDEYTDQEVWAQISKGWTLGCFQIETSIGTRTVKQIKPRSLADLSDCTTLGRPGPMNSGLDKQFVRRREGKEEVVFADPRLEQVLAKTYGAMLYQEDIMAICLILANYSSDEADKVRKILGKKKPEEAKIEGVKFIARAVENGTDLKVAESLWAQMAEFALYSFNRAHAFSYATLAFWTAWLKFHYPAAYMTACLSTVPAEEIPAYISESRRLNLSVLPPDINESGSNFTLLGDKVRFGLASIKGVGPVALESILAGQPYASFEDFDERGGCKSDVVKMLTRVGAFDSLSPNRKALEARLAEKDLSNAEKCIRYTPRLNEFNLTCTFDWANEPRPVGKTGKLLKAKPIPAKCAKSCRMFEMREAPTDEEIMPYTEREIRDIEMELMGIYLSSSPFDVLDADDLDALETAHSLQEAEPGDYLTAIIITGWKDHVQKNGRVMKFLKTTTPAGDMDITVFADLTEKYKRNIKVGQMALCQVKKNDRGVTLGLMEPI